VANFKNKKKMKLNSRKLLPKKIGGKNMAKTEIPTDKTVVSGRADLPRC
jgi:hypothetical protein